ncbi:signal peptidase I [Fervidicoccus fontis]|uniref:Peptidase S26B, signal peptidase n=1 Tax=Fervidicoccus fontis (strain DSM 19380 / JCM 18336 / VKM B-2539 / Kam940) TaxID=1163730 RepID=I0A060_FERFK|nr:signal peptidase I [Fervidicoccus fontis]AFH42367.1 peptidase S26B, signal peptidase [Fervidicoccus fontis Kam940]
MSYSNRKGFLSKYKSDMIFIIVLIILVISIRPALSEATGLSNPVAVVKGTSMLPLLKEGDIVFLIHKSPDQIKVGDIVVYERLGGGYIIHRVVAIENISGVVYYTTKGDNNPIDDSALGQFPSGLGITYDRIIGVVWSPDNRTFVIPYLGYVTIFIESIV